MSERLEIVGSTCAPLTSFAVDDCPIFVALSCADTCADTGEVLANRKLMATMKLTNGPWVGIFVILSLQVEVADTVGIEQFF